jgi:hypothetical protein
MTDNTTEPMAERVGQNDDGGRHGLSAVTNAAEERQARSLAVAEAIRLFRTGSTLAGFVVLAALVDNLLPETTRIGQTTRDFPVTSSEVAPAGHDAPAAPLAMAGGAEIGTVRFDDAVASHFGVLDRADAPPASPADFVHDVAMTLDTVTGQLDPTPEQQAERFAEIAATPRPDATEVKAALETLDEVARIIEPFDADYAAMLPGVAAIVDRLGVECIALDLRVEVAEARARHVSKALAPAFPTDAELIERATRYAEWLVDGREPPRREMATTFDRLVAALNGARLATVALTDASENPPLNATDRRKLLAEANQLVNHKRTAGLLGEGGIGDLVQRLADAVKGSPDRVAELEAERDDMRQQLADEIMKVSGLWDDVEAWQAKAERAKRRMRKAKRKLRNARRDIVEMRHPTLTPGERDAAIEALEQKSGDPSRNRGMTRRYYQGETVDTVAAALGFKVTGE